ncbi:MAG TPA: hypothetical protein VGC89_19790 [Pyrinomonadaceae bacterium]
MEILKTMLTAARRLKGQWRVMAVLAAVYAALLAALFFFVATTEATAWQIALTLCFAALAPALFFLLQAIIVNYARGETRASLLLRRSFTDSCKLALVSVPLALTVVLVLYLLNKLQPAAHVWTAQTTPPDMWRVPPWQRPNDGPTTSLRWMFVAWTTLRFLFCYVALPLAAVQLWSAVVRDGLLPTVRRTRHHLARAFAPDVALTYAVGLLLFGLIPYALIFIHTPAARPSVEFGLFIARLLLVFVFTLYGWALTFDALAGMSAAARATNANADVAAS